jgi:outer membrane protein TolC
MNGMTTAVFDTLKAARHLEDAGIETKQAEAIVTTMAKAFDDSVATKADLAALKADLAAVKAELKQDNADLKAELATAVNRMLLAQLAIAGLLFAALKLF